MSRIKEFYHDEICNGFNNEVDEIPMEIALEVEAENLKEQIANFEFEKEAVESSDVPSFHHSKF